MPDAVALTPAAARRLRLASLLLAGDPRPSAADIVEWFGAMQAQDLASGHWSFGVRLPGSTVADVEQATEDRQIVRSWPMRGTIHYVPPRDLHWMLEVTGVRALAGAAKRRENIGLSEADANQGAELLGQALAGGKRMTRAACVAMFTDAGLATASQHGYHLLWYASQLGVTCIGPQEGKEQTFVLLDEWVADPVRLDRDEALAVLARRFVQSHGPVTAKDFAGWTGLTMGDARAGIAALGDEITSVAVNGVEHLVMASALDAVPSSVPLLLLPGFDEFLLGYKDRSPTVPDDHRDQIIPGGNGIFSNTVVVDGRVVGTWKRAVKRGRLVVTPTLFGSVPKRAWSGLDRAAQRMAEFLEAGEAELVR